jgi:hypothetical protein
VIGGIFMPESHPTSKSAISAPRRARVIAHSTIISNAVLLGYARLSDGARLTYMVLESYDWPDKDGYSKGKCWPSIETLATARGKSYDTIARHLKELEASGLIRVESGQDRGVANCYWLLGPSEQEVTGYLKRYTENPVTNEVAGKEGRHLISEKGVPQECGISLPKNALPAPANLPEEKHEFQELKTKNPEMNNDSNHFRSPAGKKVSAGREVPKSAYISQIAFEFSKTLNDLTHSRSNQTQAQNLFIQSGLDERAFVEVLYEAKKRTQWAAMATPKTVGNGPNRAAYFFRVVRDLLSNPNRPVPGNSPVAHRTGRAHVASNQNWHGRSLSC